MQSFDENNQPLKSIIGDINQVDPTKALKRLINDPLFDHAVITDFKEGEIVELKGLKFKIQTIKPEKKKLTLKLMGD